MLDFLWACAISWDGQVSTLVKSKISRNKGFGALLKTVHLFLCRVLGHCLSGVNTLKMKNFDFHLVLIRNDLIPNQNFQ